MKISKILFCLVISTAGFLANCYYPAYTPPAANTTTTTTSEVVLTGGEGSEVIAEGVAAITTSADIARDQALKDALRKAVEQGVGSFINSETRVENFQLLSDRIYSQATGYVSSYRIVSESRETDLYRVIIRAKVKMEKIENDLQAIGILVTEQGRPRIMVVVRRVASTSQIAITEQTLEPEMIETMLSAAFSEKGFPVVDRATLEKILNSERLKRILEGDERTAILLGLESGAEIGVFGTMQEATERKTVPYASQEKEFYRVDLNVRAVNLKTGEIIGATALTAAVPFSPTEARRQAADSTSRVLISRILTRWQRRQNLTQIYATEADHEKIERLKSEIMAKVRGVQAVITRQFIGTTAVIEIVSETATPEIIQELTGRNLAIPFQIQGYFGNRIDIKFITEER